MKMERISVLKKDGCNGVIMGTIIEGGIITIQGMAILNASALSRHGIDAATAANLNKAGRWAELPADCLRRINEDADGVELILESDRDARIKATMPDSDIPQAARAAKARYGTFDQAWAAEDEHAAMLIDRYYQRPIDGNDPVTKDDM